MQNPHIYIKESYIQVCLLVGSALPCKEGQIFFHLSLLQQDQELEEFNMLSLGIILRVSGQRICPDVCIFSLSSHRKCK